MKYVRPDMNDLKSRFASLTEELKSADTFDTAESALLKINELRNEFESMKTIAFINYSINTENKFYCDEQDFFDDKIPEYEESLFTYYHALLNSRFRAELEKKFGSHLFKVSELSLKSLDPSLTEDMRKENHLCSRYVKLKASAKINFDGGEKNLQELEPYMESKDREVRKKAFAAYWKFFDDNSHELDSIFDELVKLRHDMALKMKHSNYVPLGYINMGRADYNQQMVEKFREHVRKYLVPLSMKFREKQRKRLGLDKLTVYDLLFHFNSGNAKPKGNPEWVLDKGKLMYDELSDRTKEFFDFMMNNGLLDVYSRKGKADMGYCDYIAKYKSPFIFANMNGTDDDITVLTHEAGHAFQAYESRNFILKEYSEPTMETAEIHSMSMEFFTYPWMNLFFESDTEKFKFSHLIGAVNFLPYGVLVDEFQHWVYENPEATPKERNSKWRELEKIYMPHLDYDGIAYLENGGRWQKQGHIYEMPFYYIDYCLAQICALQFWSKAIHNGNGQYKSALDDYIKLCGKGGSKPFLELVRESNLSSPFEESVIAKLAEEVERYIDSVDDNGF